MRIKKQITNTDCGLCVVEAMHNFYFGQTLDIDQLRQCSKITEQGLSVQSLIDLGQEYGLNIEAFNASFSSINDVENEPMIAIIENDGLSHYVIFQKQGEKYKIYDSARGKYILDSAGFEKIYKGMVMTVSRGQLINEIKNTITVWSLIAKNASLMIWIIICLLIGIIFAFTSTLFAKIIFDYVIPGQLKETLKVVVIAFISIAILRVLNGGLKGLLTRKLELIIEYDFCLLFINKIKTGNLKTIHKFSKQEYLRRYFLISPASVFVASGLFIVVNEVVVFVISVTILLWISLSLFIVAFCFGMFAVLITYVFHFFLKPECESAIEKQIINFKIANDIFNNLNSCKENDVCQYIFNSYCDSFVQLKRREMSIWKMISTQKFVIEIINYVAPIVLTYLSVKMIFSSQISVGSMLMFLGLFNTFISPLIQLCIFITGYHQSIRNVEQVMAIINIDDEVNNINGLKLENICSIKLDGLKFGFDKEIINIDKLQLSESVKIVGRNGIGKSTLLNIIAFRYQCNALYFNDIEALYYSNESIRKSIYLSSINQELICDSIINQITNKSKKSLIRFNDNIEKYQLHFIFKSLHINLNDQVISGGTNLSSGQRQVIKLMRLFANDWKLIILDEAFENIDHETFTLLAKAIAAEHKDKLFIETSHSGRYILESKEINLETINKNQ